MKKRSFLLIAVGFVAATTFAQTTPSDLYQYNYTTVSPAFAGVEGQRMTLTGNIYSKTSGDYDGSGFIGYETRIDKIKSGIGFTVDFRASNIQTQSNINLVYNYQLDLGNDRKMMFGAKLGDNQVSFDHYEVTPIDPGDPIGYRGVVSANARTVGVGVLYKSAKYFAGISVDNAYAKIYRTHRIAVLTGYHDPQYNFILGRLFRYNEKTSSTHSIYISNTDEFWRFDINNSILFNDWLIGGISLEVNNQDVDNFFPKINAGVNFGKHAQVVFSVYSERNTNGAKKFSGQLMALFNL